MILIGRFYVVVVVVAWQRVRPEGLMMSLRGVGSGCEVGES